jgi:pimeloyl-ACP methyl ester carboxylesterase
MSFLTINNTNIHFQQIGDGKETIVFAHSLLCNLEMWEEQIQHFSSKYRCIAFDFRGQGKSETTKNGYDMDTLTEDTKELIEQLEAGPCHFVGLSMGGFVGLRLASRYPELVKSLTLIDTSMEAEDKKKQAKYRMLRLVGKLLGFKVVVGNILPIMFSYSFLKDPAKTPVKDKWIEGLLSSDRKGVLNAVLGVTTRKAVTEEDVERIKVPSLIIVGEKDVATPPHESEKIKQHIPHADFVIIPGVGHLANYEKPGEVNKELEQFFLKINMA